MSLLKNVKNRIIAFCAGVILTIAGAILLYFDFFGKKDQWYSDTSSYSYATFFIGIAALLIAFEKKKKEPDQKEDPGSKP